MEVPELLEGEVGDGDGVATRVHIVGVVGKHGLLGDAVHHRVRLAIHPLHLIKHNSLENEVILGVLELVVPALLLKGLLIAYALWVEDGVHVDVHEVVEVLQVAGGYRVAGAVGVGEGVQEGVEGALHKLHKRLLDGVLPAAAQHAVLQDVGDASGVVHGSAQHHAKGLILVVVDEGHHLGTCLGVLVAPHIRVVLADKLLLKQLKAGKALWGRFCDLSLDSSLHPEDGC
mmetsp:Transcript_3635/g.10466  ORF Transcript_3635/g.10466 Transcript_3635/m.10466 type:complete len:230 (-) Transcript_3635:478-1167(-)